MYGEEFVQNSINSVSNNRDEVLSVGNNSVVLENKTNNLRETESDQKSKGEVTGATVILSEYLQHLKQLSTGAIQSATKKKCIYSFLITNTPR